jgi:acetyl esterase/lipase
MSRTAVSFSLTLALALSARAAEPKVIKLWPGKAPGETKEIGPEKYQAQKSPNDVKRLTNVSEPTISIYAPSKDKANGCTVIVAPGGGYSILAIEHEGTQTCEWLQSLGVTAVLLKYRVPQRNMQKPSNLAAIQDGQRAVSLTRSMAQELGIDPNRIGMLGFSAGGNLTAWMCGGAKKLYDSVDDVDKTSSRPNFAILIYPGGLIDREGHLKTEFHLTKETPPTFLVHATNDSSENSVAYYSALKKVGVPVELHLYASGGHGFGMRKTQYPSATWPDRAADWMKARGLLEKK